MCYDKNDNDDAYAIATATAVDNDGGGGDGGCGGASDSVSDTDDFVNNKFHIVYSSDDVNSIVIFLTVSVKVCI